MASKSTLAKIDTDELAVAITFDDGPNPIYTPQVLEIFDEVSGKATFFMIGEQMVKEPELVKTISEKGHEIGNHSYTHANLTEIDEAAIQRELGQNEKLIETLTGRKPAIMRPPYLAFNEIVQSVVHQFDYEAIGALNMEATDWEQPGVDHIYTASRKHVQNGSILIFHDGYGDRSQTIEAVRLLVRDLTKAGYQLVTVSELLSLSR
ncbi:polysaccharide deacetylase family protein [Pullulanibacillus sp. KACC 23026]|uniref:polysaccharide deacetylase family protein n=1 Tax=Pullulanibacillus sp. KACC 23026 TaxID=3028315 RepID=UPI0023B05B26|nr:polysaccharide deacetylase family protein [Pullulanibacillus sp. KACC 23026]WEG11871.1 polysaccharide deacetylase family protein [Pullulanibacillus sp. KACC 23026]